MRRMRRFERGNPARSRSRGKAGVGLSAQFMASMSGRSEGLSLAVLAIEPAKLVRLGEPAELQFPFRGEVEPALRAALGSHDETVAATARRALQDGPCDSV